MCRVSRHGREAAARRRASRHRGGGRVASEPGFSIGPRRCLRHLHPNSGRYPRGGSASSSARSRRPGFRPRITAPRWAAGWHRARTGNRAVGRLRICTKRQGGPGRRGAGKGCHGARRDGCPDKEHRYEQPMAASRPMTCRAGDVRRYLRVAAAVWWPLSTVGATITRVSGGAEVGRQVVEFRGARVDGEGGHPGTSFLRPIDSLANGYPAPASGGDGSNDRPPFGTLERTP